MTIRNVVNQIITQIIAGKLHEALVECYQYLISDISRFNRVEKQALESPEAYRNQKQLIAKLLLENQKLKLLNASSDFPLALLEVLDRYLFERYNRSGNSPAPRVTVGGESFYIHRRVIGYKNPPPALAADRIPQILAHLPSHRALPD
jgi:hypothetical protein